MWAYEGVFYQFSTLGFCGAPSENDGVCVNRIEKVKTWIPHLAALGVNAVYFCPVFDSDRHGYDTRDYRRIDPRLGTNEDFADVCRALHAAGIRIVLDGVFNHVGRGFFAFRDLLSRREASPYKDWFVNVRLDWDNCYQDGLYYEGWEGHYELVRLNLWNPAVRDYLFGAVAQWIREFDIDGLRLDVAYCIEPDFLRALRAFTDTQKADFFLLGEMIHGDYNRLLDEASMMHSVTNYQAYKGIWSSLNDRNMFEINYTLEQEFCGMYAGKRLWSFVDNHDVDRLASTLKNPAHLPLAYALLFSIPGIPCVYYGSEWGQTGKKADGGDDALRPCLSAPQWTPLTDFIAKLAAVYKSAPALRYGGYRKLFLSNNQLVFERRAGEARILVAINVDDAPFFAPFDAGAQQGVSLLDDTAVHFDGGAMLPPQSAAYWKV